MRTFARLDYGVLRDPDWRKLSPTAHDIYETLLVQPRLNMCGVTDWFPKRLSTYSTATPEDVVAAGQELIKRRFIVIDEETDEVLVRSFLRHDMPLKSPKTAVSVDKAYCCIVSEKLRAAVVVEALRLYKEHPEWSGWGKVPTLREDMENADTLSDIPSDTNSDRVSDTLSDTPSHSASDTASDTSSRTASGRVCEKSVGNHNPIIQNPIIQNPESRAHARADGAATRKDAPPASTDVDDSENESVDARSSTTVSAPKSTSRKKKPRKKSSKPNPEAHDGPREDENAPAPSSGNPIHDWAPSPAHYELAAELGVDCDECADGFVDWTLREGRVWEDTEAAFRMWMRREKKFKDRDEAKSASASGSGVHASRMVANAEYNRRLVEAVSERQKQLGQAAPAYSEEDFR